MAARVLIAGGGFAALETMLALRALAGERVATTLVCPDPLFDDRPASTREAFAGGPARRYDLAAIARELGVEHVPARLSAVDVSARRAELDCHRALDYDALVLAVGVRAIAGLPGAIVFRDQRDRPAVSGVLADFACGVGRRLTFAVPPGRCWPLPLYELALQAAARAPDAELTLVTPERAPLEVFGADAAHGVAQLLDQAGVRFLGGRLPQRARLDGTVELQADRPLAGDRVITVPQLIGHRIPGVPAGWWGFVPTDALGRVEDCPGVYAAGDMTAFPVKHGGLATQQADRIAASIAGELGVPVRAPDDRRVLQARLIGGPVPLLLRVELDWEGRPIDATSEWRRTAPAPVKVSGRYLAPYLESLAPLVA